MAIAHIVFLQFLLIVRTPAYDDLVKPGISVATISTTYQNYNASRAVDGDFTQDLSHCSHTDDKPYITEAWLRVDLKRTFSLKSVQFWYRGSQFKTKRLPGYSIRVSNTSSLPPPDSICYQDPPGNTTLPSVIEKDCERTAQYVWIYQNNTLYGYSPMLEICEVQIFGCGVGRFGDTCNKTCDHCQNSDNCGIVSGECDGLGCANKNFYPQLCKECIPGMYGRNCTEHCSTFCRNKSCDRNTGTCLHGCARGYNGSYCNQTCPSGTYGYDCRENCGQCIQMQACNYIDGYCAGGCNEGFKGELCNTSCSDGKYGNNCVFRCSGNCLNNAICNKLNGKCYNCSSGYEGPKCDTHNENNQIKAEIVVISVVLFLILIVIGMVVLFLYRRKARNQSSQKPEDDNVYHLPDIIKDENEYDELNTYEETESSRYQQPVSPISQRDMPQSAGKQPKAPQSQPTDVTIPDLLSRIQALEQHSKRGFLKEYEAIYVDVSDCSCKVGRLQENLTKNVLATTLPYDHSRVVLQSTPDNYVNASFIKNMNGKKTYIASQEPNRNTFSNFWQMVWQENVNVIAMTATMSDCQQRKSQKYWPDSTASDINQRVFVIHLQSEKTYSTFTIREFQLIKKETRESRQIRHLQFTAWPDRGMPRPLDLLMYYRYVSRAMEKHSESTLLVQCSSGSGPTAVVIALDALYKHGQKTGMVNIADFVRKMRMDRMNMIENLEQYICLYHALNECFRTNVGVVDKDHFLTESTHENISNEFHILSSIKPNIVDIEKPLITDGSTEYQNIMADEDKTYTLQSSAGAVELLQCSAVLLPSFTTKDCIIAGRYPSHGEAVDLIHLLINQECSTLVSIHPMSEVPYTKEWFSPSIELHSCHVEVIPVAKMSEHVTLSTLRSKKSQDQNWYQTTLYELTSWKYSENNPCDTDAVLDVIKSVQLDKCVDVNKKLVILSKDGATGCGVFCAVYNAIQQLQQDEEVDMFTIVRQLQSRRPEMISDMSEYQCCYNALKRYLERK